MQSPVPLPASSPYSAQTGDSRLDGSGPTARLPPQPLVLTNPQPLPRSAPHTIRSTVVNAAPRKLPCDVLGALSSAR